MTNTDTLIALRNRVWEATGPDRELDARIWMALHPKIQIMVDSGQPDGRGGFTPAQYDDAENVFCDKWSEWNDACLWLQATPLTASVDAALALVERVLPEWTVDMVIGGGEIPACFLWTQHRAQIKSTAQIEAKTLPLAILDAFLTALIEQEPKP